METKENKGWSPYLAGALSGLVAILSVWIAGKYFGVSTAFVRSAGMIEKMFVPEHVANLDYFARYTPKIDWQFMFVVGVFVGALIASIIWRDFHWQAIPNMWKARFGSSGIKRGIVAFVGAGIAIFGVRLAGGCPSGHGISGVMQLSISGFVALICFFIGGLAVARILFRGGKK